jgi:hypothetical protein
MSARYLTKKNMNKKSMKMLLAAASVLVVSSTFATQPTYNDEDTLLGFRVLAGTGLGSEGIIDLGQVSQFTTTSHFTLSLGSIGTFMTSNFGSDWFTRSTSGQVGKTDIQWAAVATDNQTNFTNDMWSTRNPTVRSTPWTPSADQSQPSNDIFAVGQQYSNASNSIAAGTTSAVKEGTVTNGWTFYQPGGSGSFGISFAYFNPTNEGNTSTVLDFDFVQAGAASGTLLGTFTWNSDGTVVWTGASVVPEPSTYSMMALGGVGLVGLMILRRRRAVRA